MDLESGVNTAQHTLLLVDDEAIIRDLCAKVLKGYRIVEAGSGQEALNLLDATPVDVVLTDVMMPRMSGLELLHRIKERQPTQPVVVMTGYADKDVILKALKADADDFITKPINLLQLRTTVEKVIERKAMKEELIDLKRMDRLKTEFLGLISHKLKTPTTAISLFIQNLAHGIGDINDPAFQQTLKMILEESTYLEGLIQDLLSFSNIILKENSPQAGDIALDELARVLVTELMPRARERNISIEADFPSGFPTVRADREHMRFVLHALLDNAIKFCREEGHVSIRADQDQHQLRILIEDDGIGLAREEIPKVFEKFYQVDPQRTGQVRGFGLGLYYARRFVHRLGGNLSLESEPGRGTTAAITLPL